jgi:hypothetical protein
VTVQDHFSRIVLVHPTAFSITLLPSPVTSVKSAQVVPNKPVNPEFPTRAEYRFEFELESSPLLFN